MTRLVRTPSRTSRRPGLGTATGLRVGAALACTVLLAACGGGGSNDNEKKSGERTVAEVATYRGPDRTKLLEEGARKEGHLVVYTSNTATEAAAKEFGKKYPYIKVDTFLSQATNLLRRLSTEYQADKVNADVIGMSNANMPQAAEDGFLQEFWSPELAAQDPAAIKPGKTSGNALYVADREDYTVMGFNTKLVKKEEAPDTLDELLDPKWKGKMAISGHTTGVNWVGVVADATGEDFFAKLANQKIRVQDVSAAALADLVASGEIPLSPNLGLSDVVKLKAKGATLDWVPIEPAPVAGGSDGLVSKAKHPNAAMLFIDYIHSKEGQTFMVGQGVISPRSDVPVEGVGEIDFESVDVSQKYDAAEYEKKYAEWQELMDKTFVK